MPLIVIGLIAWFIIGDPPETIANWFWPETTAPWEKVDAFYYPDRANLYLDRREYDFSDLDQCRRWVFSEAARNNDPNIVRGDYECGVGKSGDFGSLRVYRITVR